MQHRNLHPIDLSIVIGLALLSGVLAFVTVPVLSAVVAVPAILCAPGYALLRLLLPADRFSLPERGIFAVGLSIALTILTGLVLNATPWGLRVVPFTLALSAITLAIAGLALLLGTPAPARPKLDLRRNHLVLFVGAALLVIVALVISVQGVQTYQTAQFTQTWLLSADSTHLTFGLQNEEGHADTYKVVVMVNGVVVQHWDAVTLADQQQWQQVLAKPTRAGAHLTVTIYRSEAPKTVYRTVTFNVPATTARQGAVVVAAAATTRT